MAMTRDPPDAVHRYYASQLGILGSLHKTKAVSCPIALTVKKKVLKGSQGEDIICQSPIGLPRTVRIQHLLEDLHFHKTQIDAASNFACIWRVARLITASTFCSKHNPWDFEAPFEERFAAIRGKALACPPFAELPHAVAPQTLMGSKRARVDDSYPATPSPPKRARSSRAESHLPCQTLGLAKDFDATAGFQMNDATGGYGGLYGGGLPVGDDLFSYDGEILSFSTQTLLSTPPEPMNATTTMQSVYPPQHPQQMTPVGHDLFSYDGEMLSLSTQTLLSTPPEPMNATTTMQSVHPPQHPQQMTPAEPMNTTTTMQSVHPPQHPQQMTPAEPMNTTTTMQSVYPPPRPQQMTPPSPSAEKLARINVAPDQYSQPTSSVSSAGQWDQPSQSTSSVSSELSSWDEAEWLQWLSNEWFTVGPEENSC